MKHILNETILESNEFKWTERTRLDKTFYVTQYNRGKDTLTYKLDGDIHTWSLVVDGKEVYNDILLDDDALETLLSEEIC